MRSNCKICHRVMKQPNDVKEHQSPLCGICFENLISFIDKRDPVLATGFALFELKKLAERERSPNCNMSTGRPRIHDPDRIRQLRSEGLSYRAIKKETGAPFGTITSALKNDPSK